MRDPVSDVTVAHRPESADCTVGGLPAAKRLTGPAVDRGTRVCVSDGYTVVWGTRSSDLASLGECVVHPRWWRPIYCDL